MNHEILSFDAEPSFTTILAKAQELHNYYGDIDVNKSWGRNDQVVFIVEDFKGRVLFEYTVKGFSEQPPEVGTYSMNLETATAYIDQATADGSYPLNDPLFWLALDTEMNEAEDQLYNDR